MHLDLKANHDSDKSGKINKAELEAYLDGKQLNNEQRAYLFDCWKPNSKTKNLYQ